MNSKHSILVENKKIFTFSFIGFFIGGLIGGILGSPETGSVENQQLMQDVEKNNWALDKIIIGSAFGVIIGLIGYRIKNDQFEKNKLSNEINPKESKKKTLSRLINLIKPDKKQEKSLKYLSLLLITTSEKIRDKIEVDNIKNGECNKSVSLETVKNLINTSRYFLIENTDTILEEAKTSTTLPDLDKDNLFILKITGQGRYDIGKYNTKLWLRDSITSETCQIEKVLHLLDASIAEKFVPTI